MQDEHMHSSMNRWVKGARLAHTHVYMPCKYKLVATKEHAYVLTLGGNHARLQAYSNGSLCNDRCMCSPGT